MHDEDQLIRRIVRIVPSLTGAAGRRFGLPLGIGDDALALRFAPDKGLVVTVDAFIEDVHFWADRHPPDSVGYKALARATSDLAAMGATPKFFLMTIALPRRRTGSWLGGFLAGMARAARELGVKLVGGDTTQASKVWMSLTVMGEIARSRAVPRSGAKPGDILYVSGTLGRAQLGLELMRWPIRRRRRMMRLLQVHLYPKIRAELGAWLATRRLASAMMDISDGLSKDLVRLCNASGVGARIYAERIPCVSLKVVASAGLKRKQLDPLEMALSGGDDYELLFSVPKKLVPKLKGAPGFRDLRSVGEITRGPGISLVGRDGTISRLSARGWDPFRNR